jgi:hypothetical protein
MRVLVGIDASPIGIIPFLEGVVITLGNLARSSLVVNINRGDSCGIRSTM